MSKTAVVTGASRGIGYETALALAGGHHTVIATARSLSDLKKLEEEFPDHIRSFSADLTKKNELNNLLNFVKSDFAPVDILINNAGALINKPFEELDKQDWQKMLDVNLLATIQLTKGMLPHFNQPAHIVNISSMGGFQGSAKFPGLSAYSVAKGAVSILSECLAAEFADRDISVNALCLGAVQTEMLNEAFPGVDAPVSAEEMGHYLADFALNGSNFYNGKILPVAMDDPG